LALGPKVIIETHANTRNHMPIHKTTLFSHLAKRKKTELLEILSSAFDTMPESMRSLVFDAAYQDGLIREWDAARLLAEIRQFRVDSLSKKYYAPFDMDAKNYRHIPEETQNWFDQLGRFIDLCVKAVEQAANYEFLACFEACFHLITLMEENVEIVFAHEYGSWMIPAQRGYLNAYAKAWAQVGTPEEFAEKVGPCLVRDSSQSFADKVYANILQYANPAQLAALQHKIERDKIKVPLK
jgi:hypothetical protein